MADDEEYRLIIDGLQCPPEYTHILTPLEFEELVLAFREHDPERTGLIPVEAFKDVCRSLDYTLSKDVVEKMFVEVDGDGGIEVDEDGLVDMDELCRIAVMAKTCPQGRVMHISEKLLDLHTTPFVELHREAGKRNLRPKFACLDIRDTSDVGLAVHVSEVRVPVCACVCVSGALPPLFSLFSPLSTTPSSSSQGCGKRSWTDAWSRPGKPSGTKASGTRSGKPSMPPQRPAC